MFSENHKITARQVQCLLVVSWIGKMCLLLPEFAEKAVINQTQGIDDDSLRF